MLWNKGLQTAPKEFPDGKSLLVILPDCDYPEAIKWSDYPPDLANQIGEVGYWDYVSDNISEITGGISPDQLENAHWAIIDLPGIAP